MQLNMYLELNKTQGAAKAKAKDVNNH